MSHFPLLQNWENTENIIGFTWYCNRADVYNMPHVWEIFNTFQLNYIFVWVLPRTKLEKALGCRVVSDIMVYLGGEPLKQKRQLQEWVKEGRNVHTKKICWGHCCERHYSEVPSENSQDSSQNCEPWKRRTKTFIWRKSFLLLWECPPRDVNSLGILPCFHKSRGQDELPALQKTLSEKVILPMLDGGCWQGGASLLHWTACRRN